jgi:uncharacterized oxidoreductase
MQLSHNKILITGGGSGIGLGLTERFLHENNTVIICGRRADVLESVKAKHPSVITRVCDISVASERESLIQWIAETHADLNVLINNAGIQQWTSVTDDDFYSRIHDEIQINIEAPVHLMALSLKLPSLNTIINVTSGLSLCPLVKVANYSASKAFMHSFTMSMQKELENRNIEVIEMIPPALNTDLGGKGLHDWAPPVSGFIDAIFEQLQQGKSHLTYGTSESLLQANPEQIRQAFERMNG